MNVYGGLLGKGLAQADFRRRNPKTNQHLDLDCYQALHNWLRNNAMSDDVDRPSRPEITDRLAQNIESLPEAERAKMAARIAVARAARLARRAR
jgi:hypothetical protein